MPLARLLVTQGGADTATYGTIATGLTVDGKAGWRINQLYAIWKDIAAVAAGDYLLKASLASETGDFDEEDPELIMAAYWACQNTAGVAVAFPVEPKKEAFGFEDRVTVQANLYCGVVSSNTAQANDVIFVVQYDIVKLSDLEVMRLLAGGS